MKRFVDTNILVYAEDRDSGPKHNTAVELVLDLWDNGAGVVSIQVLQEFFVTVTRKMRYPMKPPDALEVVQQYLTWEVGPVWHRETTEKKYIHGSDGRIS